MRRVVFVAMDDFQLLDLAGPLDVVRAAGHLGADPPYEAIVATPGGGPVRSESGLLVGADASVQAVAEGGEPVDTLVVVGGIGARALVDDAELLHHLRLIAGRTRRTTAVCTGAMLLAAAGLLEGYQATTHWAFCAELAHTIAGWLVVFVRRPGGQAQFSAQLRSQPARTPAIGALQRWLPDHLDEDLSVARLAGRSGMSSRSFARTFVAETGTTPAAYVEELRVEAARRLLETSDLTVETVAKRVGFRRPETLYRAFRRRVATTPDRYRQHFAMPARPVVPA